MAEIQLIENMKSEGAKKSILRIIKVITINFLSMHITYQNSILIYTILPKVLGHSLLMKGLSTLVISMSTNLNV